MFKTIYITILLIAIITNLNTQVGIGTETPHNSAILEIESTTKGFLLPRVNTDADVMDPTMGLMIYDLSDKCINVYTGQ